MKSGNFTGGCPAFTGGFDGASDPIITGGGIIYRTSTYRYGGSLSVAGSETSPTGLWFKPDGTKVFYVGTNADRIVQHTLSTAWDVTTANGATTSPVLTGTINISGIAFDDTAGDKLLVVDAVNNSLVKYSMTTAWDVTTLNTTAVQTNTAIFTGNVTPSAVWARSNGLQLILANSGATNTYRTVTMTVAWDISTAAVSATTTVAAMAGVNFINSGANLAVLSTTGGITTYTTSAAYSIATPTTIEGSALFAANSPPLASCSDMYWRDNGTSFYIINLNTDAIHQWFLI